MFIVTKEAKEAPTDELRTGAVAPKEVVANDLTTEVVDDLATDTSDIKEAKEVAVVDDLATDTSDAKEAKEVRADEFPKDTMLEKEELPAAMQHNIVAEIGTCSYFCFKQNS
jgi:hypothetical protein